VTNGKSELSAGRDHSNGSASGRSRAWEAWKQALCWATSSQENELSGWNEAAQAFNAWWEKTETRDESLDELHPRDAEETPQVD